jgi:hypothetical protein
VDVDNAIDFGPRSIEPRVNKHLLRRFQLFGTVNLLSGKIHRDNVVSGHKTQARLSRASRLDKNSVRAGNPRADVAAGLFGQIELAQYPARARYKFTNLLEVSHSSPSCRLAFENTAA